MSIKKVSVNLQNWLATFDWKLLVFLLLFLNVKLVVKVAAVIIIYILRNNFKFGFAVKNSRLPIFYIIVIAIAIFNWLISGLLTSINYSAALFTGILFWLLCILAIHQVKLAVEKSDSAIIHKTLLLFFIINAVASLAAYGSLVWETGAINVYKYQGNFQKYFIGTGDYIKGITLDTSTTNAALNAFGVVYFLLRNKYAWALFCMAMLLLTGSNIINLLLAFALLYVFIFKTNKNQKSIIVVCLLFVVVFLAKISPQNNRYVASAYEKFFNKKAAQKITVTNNTTLAAKPDSILTPEEKKQKIAQQYIDSMSFAMVAKNNSGIKTNATANADTVLKQKPVIPQPDIHSAPFQQKKDTTAFQASLINYVQADSIEKSVAAAKKYNLPGKIIALLQTYNYFKLHPFKIITGSGMGMFSSKLAFKISALKIAGGYPVKYAFVNDDFKNNTLALYLNYFTKSASLHSLINTPNSTLGQLMSEYGLAGLCSFIIFYLGFFVKHIKKLTYGIPVLLLMSALFFMDYWFEQLSIIILFELLLLLDIKENTKRVSAQQPL